MRAFGKYRLVEPLASGGMADLWRAEVSGAEGVVKEVALKLVRGEHAEKSAFLRMFVQEARLAARLTHANVVQVFEFDQVDGCHYLAMELVRGRNLGQVVERARERGVRLGVPRATHLGAEVARGLAYAHRLAEGGRPLGLVHRDVSPHNVLVSFEGEVKLADFGIARAASLAEATDPGTVKGKLAYMAPEQARGDAVDARADVFSLGVVLWELYAGRRLFARETDVATVAALLGDEPVSPPSAWNEEVPAELDAAILAALERDPARRTASAEALATALSRVLLRVTRSPEDVDLRAFMHRLFERESAAQGGAPRHERTRVRSAPAARGAPAEHEDETRTAVATRKRGLRRRLAGAIAAAALVAGAGWGLRRTVGPATATTEDEGVHPERGAAGAARSGRASAPSPASGPGATARSAATPTANATPTSTATATATSTPTSTPTATPTSTATSTPTASPTATPTATSLEAIDASMAVHAIGRLRTPPAQSGEGILSVHAARWGMVVVDGVPVGETPQEIRIRAGLHRVRVDRPHHRGVEAPVTVVAGHRTNVSR